MKGDGQMALYCRKCERLTLHVGLVWREAIPPVGRRITAKCSECEFRCREGFVIHEEGKS